MFRAAACFPRQHAKANTKSRIDDQRQKENPNFSGYIAPDSLQYLSEEPN
jgi:hypothetical protein